MTYKLDDDELKNRLRTRYIRILTDANIPHDPVRLERMFQVTRGLHRERERRALAEDLFGMHLSSISGHRIRRPLRKRRRVAKRCRIAAANLTLSCVLDYRPRGLHRAPELGGSLRDKRHDWSLAGRGDCLLRN
jgi:hypothetical protein